MSNRIGNTKLRDFEFRLLRRLQALGVSGGPILLACSGGADSVVLVHALSQIAARLQLQVVVATVHHGPSTIASVRPARDQAVKTVRELGEKLGIEVMVLKHQGPRADSEQQLRELRFALLSQASRERRCRWLALAHHADDLLETRLIRLIRGTGPQGLEAMRELSQAREVQLLRPLLSEPRQELLRYAGEVALKWCDDPSNASQQPLRNWLRLEWLERLEAKRPGSRTALARSLDLLAQAVAAGTESNNSAFAPAPAAGATALTLACADFAQLGIAERRQKIAALLLRIGARDFSAQHVAEICKRLATRRKSLRFEILHLTWSINAGRISVCRTPTAT